MFDDFDAAVALAVHLLFCLFTHLCSRLKAANRIPSRTQQSLPEGKEALPKIWVSSVLGSLQRG